MRENYLNSHNKTIKPEKKLRSSTNNEHYWSEYRRNYEITLEKKMEEDRKKVQTSSVQTQVQLSNEN